MIAPIVSAAWLAERRATSPPQHGDRPRPVTVADVRWYLDGRSGLDAYLAEHIAGAVWIDLDRWLAEHRRPEDGRHPLPRPEHFARGMSEAGIGDDTVVVAYDDQGGLVAGRLVWMLRRTGHDAALLDGGLGAWPGERRAGAEPAPSPASFTPSPWPAEHFATTDEVRQRRADTALIDARAAERYRGEVEPIDPQAGHIPGALSMPLQGNLGPDGRFLPPDQLAERFAPLAEHKDLISYCGSGVSACHNLLALEATGRLGKLYVGSWSAWSSTPNLEVATGEEPGQPGQP